tara:strand:+ start:13002 stop:13232 length:231 start_codon:yes stop_codon:yes gene_type:complete
MFIFSLATKLKMLVRDIECNMGADEYVEWIAYYQLQNDEFKANLEQKMLDERPDTERFASIKSFLRTISGKKPSGK